jgi:hypothetical protein
LKSPQWNDDDLRRALEPPGGPSTKEKVVVGIAVIAVLLIVVVTVGWELGVSAGESVHKSLLVLGLIFFAILAWPGRSK